MNINHLLSRSAELEAKLTKLLALATFDDSDRLRASKVMCAIAFEHAESAKILIASGNLTSATALVRLQFESMVRAMWLLYAATDTAVSKLVCELNTESAKRGDQLPMLSEMIKKLQGKAPQEPMDMLLEFKAWSWKPLSSYVHGGIHAFNRHSQGYPVPLLEQVLKISNGASTMVGMLLVILHGGGAQLGKITQIQIEFADCLPNLKQQAEG